MFLNKSILFTAVLSLAASVTSTHATTVGFGADPGSRGVFLQDLTTLVPNGSLVWEGTFANESFSMGTGTIATNVAAIQLAGSWSQFTNDTGGSPQGTLTISPVLGTGRIGGSVTNTTTPGVTAFNGKSVYLWVFNATTVASATQMGIFRASPASIWVFPTNDGGIADNAAFTTGSSDPMAGLIGAVSSTKISLAAPTAVPEPSTVTFGALAALAAAGVRRRRRK